MKIEAGEPVVTAARRELAEKTGLAESVSLMPLCTLDRFPQVQGRLVRIRRHCFRVTLGYSPPRAWEHIEQTPSDGSPPIRFSLFWLPIAGARRRLGYGFADALDLIDRPSRKVEAADASRHDQRRLRTPPKIASRMTAPTVATTIEGRLKPSK